MTGQADGYDTNKTPFEFEPNELGVNLKKYFVILLLLAVALFDFSACGLSDRVDGDALDTLYNTEEVADEVRDRYYEGFSDIKEFQDTVVDIVYNGKTYHITDKEVASTLLFSVTQVVLYETKASAESQIQMQIQIQQNGEITYEADYPILTVTDRETGTEKTYYALINGVNAAEYIMDILNTK